jgi:hypothetical protein
MARSYAACLGNLAFILCLTRGLLLGETAPDILRDAIGLLALFAAIGWGLGAMAERLIRHSIEYNFRKVYANSQESSGQ